jgi:hypothetical protein
MEKLNKKMKLNNYFEEFSFGDINVYRLELLMEIVVKKNLNGKQCAISMDSFHKQTIFL